MTNNYKQVTFYLDTPLLIHYIGLEDRTRQVATTELLRLLRNLDGKICAFSHSRDELKGVLQGAATNLETPSGRGTIIIEARRTRDYQLRESPTPALEFHQATMAALLLQLLLGIEIPGHALVHLC